MESLITCSSASIYFISYSARRCPAGGGAPTQIGGDRPFLLATAGYSAVFAVHLLQQAVGGPPTQLKPQSHRRWLTESRKRSEKAISVFGALQGAVRTQPRSKRGTRSCFYALFIAGGCAHSAAQPDLEAQAEGDRGEGLNHGDVD